MDAASTICNHISRLGVGTCQGSGLQSAGFVGSGRLGGRHEVTVTSGSVMVSQGRVIISDPITSTSGKVSVEASKVIVEVTVLVLL